MLKFTQIATANHGLYALDSHGKVWQYLYGVKEGWHLLSTTYHLPEDDDSFPDTLTCGVDSDV